MDTSPIRRRAPGMSVDQRRAAIVQAALPLVAEYGAAVTTATIARAAGIGEATIFRVFEDKDAVLRACVATAMDPTAVLRELASISLEQPLEDRLVDATDTLDAHFDLIGAVIGALHASGAPSRRRATPDPTEPPRTRSSGRDEARAATREAVTALFEPDRARLRLPADTLADAFLGLFFGHSRTRQGQAPSLQTAQLVDLFLNGARSTAAPRPRTKPTRAT